MGTGLCTAMHRGRSGPLRARRRALVATLVFMLVLSSVSMSGVAVANVAAAGTAHITGKVTSDGTTGIGGIRVTAWRQEGGGWWNQVQDTESNASGVYDLPDLDGGTYRVGFVDDSGTYIAKFYPNAKLVDSATDIEVGDGQTKPNINIRLAKPSAHVSGHVHDAAGAALKDVWVHAMGKDPASGQWSDVTQVQTDVNGAYDLGGLATGTYAIGFRDDPGQYIEQFYGTTSGNPDDARGLAVVVGSPKSGIDATLTLSAHIAGTVRDGAGHPLGNIDVAALKYNSQNQNWEDVGWEQTDESGAYRMGNIAGGVVRVRFEDNMAGNFIRQFYAGASTVESATDITIAAGAVTSGIDATMEGPAGHVAGRVTDAAGNPVAGIDVNITSMDANGQVTWDLGHAQTDETGHYNAGGLRTGVYRVQFWDQSGRMSETWYRNSPGPEGSVPVAVTAGATTANIDVTMAVAGHVTGRLRDPAGHPLANITVSTVAFNPDGSMRNGGGTQTREDGTYTLDTSPGSWIIAFWDDAGVYAPSQYPSTPIWEDATQVTVIGGKTVSGIDSTMKLGGHFDGRVTDDAGRPLGGIRVIVWKLSPKSHQYRLIHDWLQTNENGEYDGSYLLEAGNYRVMFADDSGAHAFQMFSGAATLESGQDVVITGGATRSEVNASLTSCAHIRGAVHDVAGAPLKDITVTPFAFDAASHTWVREHWAVSTGDDGGYDLNGLPAGTWRVQFSDSAGKYGTLCYANAVTVDAGTDVTVTVGGDASGIDMTLLTATHLVMKAPTAPVAYNASINLSAQLTTGSPVGGREVQVWRSTGGAFVADGKATWDAASGTYKATRKATQNTTFQFRFAGDTLLSPSSASAAVKVKAKLSQPTVPASVKKGAAFKVNGNISPGEAVRVEIRRSTGGGKSVLVASATCKPARSSATFTFSAMFKLTTKGAYFVQTVHSDANHAATTSAVRNFTVK